MLCASSPTGWPPGGTDPAVAADARFNRDIRMRPFWAPGTCEGHRDRTWGPRRGPCRRGDLQRTASRLP